MAGPSHALTGSTTVTFPRGDVAGRGRVLAAVPVGHRTGLVCDITPFHPVDHTWPDHPADHGTLTVGDATYPVVDCVVGAQQAGADTVHLGEDIPVRRGADGWHWLVVHVVDDDAGHLVGSFAELRVDEERRAGLSAGHTACELVTLAINEAMADRWRKEVPGDVRGVPDFDSLAIRESRIHPFGSRDDYRLGKSLRKRGFVTEGLAEALPDLVRQINELMTAWVQDDSPVWIESGGEALTDRRTWNCALTGGTVSVACGGTHETSTGRLGAVTVALELSADGTALTMRTEVAGPSGALRGRE